MFRTIPVSIKAAFAFAFFAASVIWMGVGLKLIPSEIQLEQQKRLELAKLIANRTLLEFSEGEANKFNLFLTKLVRVNPDVDAIAIILAEGSIYSGSENFEDWIEDETAIERTTSLRISGKGDEYWGKLQIVFAESKVRNLIPGISNSHLNYTGLVFVFLFIVFLLFFKKLYKEVDPSKVVPSRVQHAFDTMSEGVLVLDKTGLVLLCNKAFSRILKLEQHQIVGKDASKFNWIVKKSSTVPWQKVMDVGGEIKDVEMQYETKENVVVRLVVNASNIEDASGFSSGCLVTFDDVTNVVEANQMLELALFELEESKAEIIERNEELEYIASHDAMTECLNRRAFFEKFELVLERACKEGFELGSMMVDLDHFKSVNDNYGHAVGDRVIQGVAEVLRRNCDYGDFVGRYGGEEFAVVIVGENEEQVFERANQIRQQIISDSPSWFPDGRGSTGSIGLAMRKQTYHEGACEKLLDCADQALYRAKETGRNKVVSWSQVSA